MFFDGEEGDRGEEEGTSKKKGEGEWGGMGEEG